MAAKRMSLAGGKIRLRGAIGAFLLPLGLAVLPLAQAPAAWAAGAALSDRTTKLVQRRAGSQPRWRSAEGMLLPSEAGALDGTAQALRKSRARRLVGRLGGAVADELAVEHARLARAVVAR